MFDNLEGDELFGEFKRRADVIDAVMRMLEVIHENKHGPNLTPAFDQYQVRAAVAMAVSLYADNDQQMISMMKRLVTDKETEDGK